MGEKELDLGNNSFYDFPKINPTDNDVPSGGPVRDIPGRTQTTPMDMTTMKAIIHGYNKTVNAPENDPRKWNMGGDGNWWSVFPGTESKEEE